MILLPSMVEKRVELAFKVDTFTVDAVMVLPVKPIMVVPPVINILDNVMVLPTILENMVEFTFKVDTLIVDTST